MNLNLKKNFTTHGLEKFTIITTQELSFSGDLIYTLLDSLEVLRNLRLKTNNRDNCSSSLLFAFFRLFTFFSWCWFVIWVVFLVIIIVIVVVVLFRCCLLIILIIRILFDGFSRVKENSFRDQSFPEEVA